MSDCRQCVDFEWCAEHEDCGLFNPKPTITNADKIRAMTDEELAKFENRRMCCPPGKPGCRENNLIRDSCYQCWLDWLRQEAGE